MADVAIISMSILSMHFNTLCLLSQAFGPMVFGFWVRTYRVESVFLEINSAYKCKCKWISTQNEWANISVADCRWFIHLIKWNQAECESIYLNRTQIVVWWECDVVCITRANIRELLVLYYDMIVVGLMPNNNNIACIRTLEHCEHCEPIRISGQFIRYSTIFKIECNPNIIHSDKSVALHLCRSPSQFIGGDLPIVDYNVPNRAIS